MTKKLTAKEIRDKLADLEALQRELLAQEARMTSEDRIKALADAQPCIRAETPEMEALLSVGYGGMTVAKAEQIIEERKKRPELWPYEELEKAQAFLEAYHAVKPQAIPTAKQPWHRTRVFA